MQKLSVKTKLVIGIAIVIVSLMLGIYTKIMLVVVHNNPFQFWLNISLYIFSWVILFVAGFFVGKETIELADESVRQKLQESYDAALELQKRGVAKGLETTKKGIATTKKGLKATRYIGKKTISLGRKTIDMHKKILGIDQIKVNRPKS